MTAPTDKELVERTLAGEREAFGALFDRYQGLVMRLARHHLGDPEAARDAAQETFLTAYRHLDRLREPQAFAAWLGQIARHTCANIHRRRQAEGGASASLDAMAEAGHHPAAHNAASALSPAAPDPAPHPADVLAARERLDAVRRAIVHLPRKYRDVIELHYTKEHSCDETARFLGLSAVAVRSRLHRARQMLAARLQREGLL